MSHSVTKKRENHREVGEYSNIRAYSETGPQSTRNSHLDAAALLGDELDLRQHGVLVDDVEERPQPVDREQLARQRAGQVETETVDPHLSNPVAQAVHDQLQDARVLHVEGVAAAAEVHVVARVLRRQPVDRKSVV